MTDWIFEQMWEIEGGIAYAASSCPEDEGFWTTRDGRRLRICDMTDAHLRNTLRMLYRNGVCRPDMEDEYLSREHLEDWWDGDLEDEALGL